MSRRLELEAEIGNRLRVALKDYVGVHLTPETRKSALACAQKVLDDMHDVELVTPRYIAFINPMSSELRYVPEDIIDSLETLGLLEGWEQARS